MEAPAPQPDAAPKPDAPKADPKHEESIDLVDLEIAGRLRGLSEMAEVGLDLLSEIKEMLGVLVRRSEMSPAVTIVEGVAAAAGPERQLEQPAPTPPSAIPAAELEDRCDTLGPRDVIRRGDLWRRSAGDDFFRVKDIFAGKTVDEFEDIAGDGRPDFEVVRPHATAIAGAAAARRA